MFICLGDRGKRDAGRSRPDGRRFDQRSSRLLHQAILLAWNTPQVSASGSQVNLMPRNPLISSMAVANSGIRDLVPTSWDRCCAPARLEDRGRQSKIPASSIVSMITVQPTTVEVFQASRTGSAGGMGHREKSCPDIGCSKTMIGSQTRAASRRWAFEAKEPIPAGHAEDG